MPKRSKNANGDNDGGAKRKRGNQGNFFGEELAFLESKRPEFFDAQERRDTRAFWPTFFAEWWAKFPLTNSGTSTSTVPEDTAASSNQSDAAEAIPMDTKTMTTRLKNWFNYQKTRKNLAVGKTVWSDWLANMRKPLTAPPIRIPAWKYYMQHDQYVDKVHEATKERWEKAGLPDKTRLAFRCKVAREMFAEEPEEVRKALEEEMNSEHDQNMQAYQLAATGAPSTDPADQQEARARLTAVVQPLLDGIRAYTGYSLTLLAGAPPSEPGGQFSLVTIHSGKTSEATPRDFATWDAKAFNSKVLDQFMRFLVQTNPNNDVLKKENQEAAADEGADSDGGHDDDEDKENTDKASSSTSSTLKDVEDCGPRSSKSTVRAEVLAPLSANTALSKGQPAALNTPLDIHPALQKELDAMTPRQRDARMEELRRMSDYELSRANNIARNSALLAEIGLSGGASAIICDKSHPSSSVSSLSGPTSTTKASTAKESMQVSTSATSAKEAALAGENEGKDLATGGVSMDVDKQSDEGHMEVDVEGRVGGQGNSSADALARVDPGLAVANTPGLSPTPATSLLDAKPNAERELKSALPLTLQSPMPSTSPSTSTSPAMPSVQPQTSTSLVPSPSLSTPEPATSSSSSAAAATSLMTSSSTSPSPSTSLPPHTERPHWVNECYNMLMHISDAVGWVAIVEKWLRLEEKYGFVSGRGLSTTERPKAVTWWLGRGRKHLPADMDIGTVDAFSRNWWSWWKRLNPTWRNTDESGRPVIGGAGSWEALRMPGPNGMFIPLVALTWWYWQTKSASTAEWETACHDCSWVLDQLLRIEAPIQIKNIINSKKRKSVDSTSAAKKRKTT